MPSVLRVLRDRCARCHRTSESPRYESAGAWFCHTTVRRATMRRFLPLAAALAVAASLAAASTISVSATSGAHFFKDTTASVNDNGALVVTIDEAGVGQQQVNYTLT